VTFQRSHDYLAGTYAEKTKFRRALLVAGAMLSCRPHMEGTMADNLRKRGSPDSKTINMKEAWEKNYWKRKFRVSGQALAGAVRAVGKSAKKVEAYLKNK
jgi:Protein of unknown function (DUF3606)